MVEKIQHTQQKYDELQKNKKYNDKLQSNKEYLNINNLNNTKKNNKLNINGNTNNKIIDILKLGNNMSFSILTGKQILELIDSDKKGNTSNGNDDLIKRLQYLGVNTMKGHKNLTTFEGGKIIAVLGLISPYREKSQVGLSHISIDQKYKNKGLSKILLKEMFNYIYNNNINTLVLSSYTEEGELYFKKNLENKYKQLPNLKVISTLGKKIQ